MKNMFRRFACWAAGVLGSPWMFLINFGVILIWLATGPLFHFSNTWQLIINTSTTIVTYLAVFLIQNTQNRDTRAIHLKLDELISSIRGARNQLIDLEDLTDDELDELKKQFQAIRNRATQRRRSEREAAKIEHS